MSEPPSAHLSDGTLHLAMGRAELQGIVPQVRWLGTDAVERSWAPQLVEGAEAGTFVPDPASGSRRAPPLALELEVESATDGLLLTLHVRNIGTEHLRLVSLAPLRSTSHQAIAFDGATRAGGWRRFQQGWQSWSNARAYGADERQRSSPLPFWRHQVPNPNHLPDGVTGHLRSEMVTVVAEHGGPAILLGFVEADRQLCGIDVDLAGDVPERVEASCDLDGVTLSPGEELASEPLLVVAGEDPIHLLERWADELGARQRARVPERPPSGWCSWYFYYTGVSAKDVADNLAAVDRLGSSTPFDYVMVDDGHQRHVGDWLDTNEKFPAGMAAMAADITATGRDAGIWLAPFIADPRARVHRDHPDWFVRHPGGRPLAPLWNPLWHRFRSMRVLDTTHPDVLAWLEELAHTVRYDWGYRILKLDFLYCASLPGVRYDPDATLATTLRLGLEAIRAGAGDDAFLLGCGCPLGPAVGIVDGMRIGSDVAPYWDLAPQRIASRDEAGATTRVAIRNTLTRAFMHQRLWSNDPDCVMVRTDRTKLSDAEVRSLAAAVALTDGMVVSSDRLDTVPADRLALFELIHTLTGGVPRVPDLLERSMPELLVSTRAEDVLVAVFNFSDRAQPRSLDAGALGLPDGEVDEVLLGGTISVVDGHAPLGVLDPHDVRVLRFLR